MEHLEELYEAILKIETKEECEAFLDDLLSKKELASLAGRVHGALMLLDGSTYQEVTEETKLSSATLARISKCLKNGKGYNSVLKK